jgi:acyl-CoA reductase-like NAD-dependent aldehyde dehydrogenase
VLELGGKSANIVLEDADLDAAYAFNTAAAYCGLAGRGCGLPTRMVVHESVHDQVVDRVRTLANAITAGDPADLATQYAPVISQAAAGRIMGMTERALLEGATLVAGGKRMDRPGFYIEPTVFTDVDPSSELGQNEVFGPVRAITKFSTDEDAIAIANSTRYGLSSNIQTRDLSRAHRIAAELEVGEVLINGAGNLAVHRPFGGIGISGWARKADRRASKNSSASRPSPSPSADRGRGRCGRRVNDPAPAVCRRNRLCRMSMRVTDARRLKHLPETPRPLSERPSLFRPAHTGIHSRRSHQHHEYRERVALRPGR